MLGACMLGACLLSACLLSSASVSALLSHPPARPPPRLRRRGFVAVARCVSPLSACRCPRLPIAASSTALLSCRPALLHAPRSMRTLTQRRRFCPADSRRQTADGGRQTAEGGRRTADKADGKRGAWVLGPAAPPTAHPPTHPLRPNRAATSDDDDDDDDDADGLRRSRRRGSHDAWTRTRTRHHTARRQAGAQAGRQAGEPDARITCACTVDRRDSSHWCPDVPRPTSNVPRLATPERKRAELGERELVALPRATATK